MTTVEEPKPTPEPEVAEDDSTADDVRSLPAQMIRSYGILDSEFPGPSAFGPGSTAIGTVNLGAGQAGQRIVNQPLDGALVLERIHTYAATATPDRLVERLARRPVAYLSGHHGGGRLTATLVALSRVHAPDRITQLHLIGDESIRTYLAEPKLLRRGHGHVVELARTAEPEPSELAQLSVLARQAHASVVLVSAGTANTQLVEYHVEHSRPDPREVFLVWLERDLRDKGQCIAVCPACEGECVQAYVARCRAEYAQYLAVSTMTDAVRFAADFAELLPDNDNAALDLLADRAALRAKAVDLLATARPQDGAAYELPRSRHLAQHRRAARLAFAVFHGSPLTTVFEATEALNKRLDEAVGRSVNDRTVLEHNLDYLLEDIRLTAPADGTVGAARIARLRQPGLVRGLLDVAWHEYDTARQPLLEWLNDLAASGDAGPIAAAAGLLCEYDFEQIRSKLLNRWATSAQRSQREAAALACEMAVLNPALTQRILGCVAGWADVSGYRRDTAVRTYATRTFRRRFPQKALEVLGRAARDDIQRTSNAVPVGVKGIYGTLGAPVVHRLVEWSDSPFANLRIMASRCLVRLADVDSGAIGEAATSTWPALLRQTAAGEVSPADHARLWPGALLHPGTARQAWSSFERWIGLAARDGDLADVLHEVLSHVLRGGPILRRADFYLRCFWRPSMPHNPSILTITSMLEDRRHDH